MVRWNHWLSRDEFEWTLGDGEGQGSQHAAVHGVTKSQTWLSNWITNILKIIIWNISKRIGHLYLSYILKKLKSVCCCIFYMAEVKIPKYCRKAALGIEWDHQSLLVSSGVFPFTLIQLFSHVWLFTSPWTVTLQASLFLGFSRWEYVSGLSFPPLGDLPTQGLSLHLLHWQVTSLPLSHWPY